MITNIESYLKRFHDLNWFHACGQIIQSDDARVHVGNWDTAIKLMKSKRSESSWFEFRNLLTERAASGAPARYNEWNFRYKTNYERVVNELFVAANHNQHSYVVPELIKGDLRTFLLEQEFWDITTSRFFTLRAEWYLAGRLPCGWEGKVPEGRLIVF